MANCENEEAICSFISVTASDVEVAKQYLSISEWNVEHAVTLFLENGGQPLRNASPSPPPRSAASEHFFQNRLERPIEFESAASLADETFTSHDSPPRQDVYDEDGIRVADPMRCQRLIGGERLPGGMPAFPFRSGPSMPPREFLREERSPFENIENDSMDDDPRSTEERVDTLYHPPPYRLLFRGTFQQARIEAKKNRRWLLVNIQSSMEFASIQLNRETWNDELVENIVRTDFIFWQAEHRSDHANKYCFLYGVHENDLPHVAIIDPRKSEIAIQWKGFIKPVELAEKLADFCDKNSYDDVWQPSTTTNVERVEKPSSTEVMEIDDDETTNNEEDDELKRAIAASLATQKSDLPTRETKQETETEVYDDSVLFLPEEPEASNPSATRIQIRTMDGKRLVRRFLLSDPISTLYTFIRHEIPETRTKPFELLETFPCRVIPESIYSIDSEKLRNSSLALRWKE